MMHIFKHEENHQLLAMLSSAKASSDGCFIAMKLFKQLKGNGEDFINEVASSGRTNHISTFAHFYGSNFEGSKMTLIYEFMPNGSLQKFIFRNGGGNPFGNTLQHTTSYC